MNIAKFRQAWPVLFSCLTALLVLVSAKFTWPDGDDGRYAIWAIAIAQGDGIMNIHLPEPTPEVAIPPGLSLALAPLLMILGGNSLKAMMVFSAVALILLAWVYAGWRIDEDRGMACPEVTDSGIRYAEQASLPPSTRGNPCPPGSIPLSTVFIPIVALWGVFTISSAWRVHTEILYMLLSFSALAWWPRKDAKMHHALIPGLLAGAAFMTRTVGLALLPAGILALVVRRQWKQAAVFSAGFILVNLPLTLRSMNLAGTPLGYSQHVEKSGLLDTVNTLFHMLPHYVFYGLPDLMFYRLIGDDGLLFKLGLSILTQPVAVAIAFLILAGFLLRIFRFSVTDLYAAGYMLIISLFNQADYAARGEFLFQDRYLIPIIPIAAIYIGRALTAMGGWGGSRAIRFSAQAILAAMTLYIAATAVGAGLSRFRAEAAFRGLHPMDPVRYSDYPTENDRAWGRYFECAFRLSALATPNAVVYARKPHEIYLASGLKSVRYLDVGAGASLLKAMDTHLEKGVYVIEDAFSVDTAFGKERAAIITPLLKEFTKRFELVHETSAPVSRVWRLRPPEADTL